MRLAKYIVTCLTGLFSLAFPLTGQIFKPNTEVGGFAGVCYYLGDINSRKQFYTPGSSIGALIKQNFTEHHSLRVNAFFGKLKGNDLDFKNEYQQMRAHSFETSVLDIHAGHEFSFRPYFLNRRTVSHTMYMFAALGYSFIFSSNTGTIADHVTIPFGVGYKYRFNEMISLGCEWGMRKTFIDNIDGLLNPGLDSSLSMLHNNDWYSFAGVFITVRVFEKGSNCPGVKQQKKYRYR